MFLVSFRFSHHLSLRLHLTYQPCVWNYTVTCTNLWFAVAVGQKSGLLMELLNSFIMKSLLLLHCFYPPGLARPSPHPLSNTRASAVPERSLPPNPSQYLKRWRLSTGATRVDGPTRVVDRATATRSGSGWHRAEPGATVQDKRAQMLKMITALEELQRTFDGTLSSRITIVPRGNLTIATIIGGI